MRLEVVDKNNYKVFINYADTKVNITDKDELGKYIKKVILRLRKIYNIVLEGLYEVNVYLVNFFGIILEIKNIDKYFGKTIDLKIIVHSDEDMFLKVKRYDLVKDYHHLNYLNNYFYLNIKDLVEGDIYTLSEDYKVVYGNELKEVKKNWVHLTT